MVYRLRFPFGSIHEITGLTGLMPLRPSGIDASLQPHSPYVVLNLEGFQSESAAAEALPRAWGAVMLASVLGGWGFQAETTLDQVVYTDDPGQAARNLHENFGLPISGPVHGLVNGNLPAVIPVDKNIRFLTAGEIGVHQSVPVSRVVPHLEEALSFQGVALAFTDERLKLALEIWSDYHRERSLRARFLTLVMALEVLTPPMQKHSVAQSKLDRWDSELLSDLGRYTKGSDEYDDLDSLRQEISFRRDRSIRGRLRRHIRDVVGSSDPEKAPQIAHLALRAYDLRGALVHSGTLEPAKLSEGHEAARHAVRALVLATLGMSHP
jgi:hypothetical protein